MMGGVGRDWAGSKRGKGMVEWAGLDWKRGAEVDPEHPPRSCKSWLHGRIRRGKMRIDLTGLGGCMRQIPGTREGTWMDGDGVVWTNHPLRPGGEKVMRRVKIGTDVEGRKVVGLVRLDGSRMRTSVEALRVWMGLGGDAIHLVSGYYKVGKRGLEWKPRYRNRH